MQRRIAATAALFTVATLATGVLGRWFPTPLEGPAAGLIVASLGALLIILAPLGQVAEAAVTLAAPEAAEKKEQPKLGREHTLPFPTTIAHAPTLSLESPEGVV